MAAAALGRRKTRFPAPAALARFISPMECRLADAVPATPGWFYELKLDGYRVIAVLRDGRAELHSRHGTLFNDRFPLLAAALRDSGLEDCVLDGEVVALDEHGLPSFQELQNSRTTRQPIVYYVFDLLHYAGRDLLQEPLRERKSLLEQVALLFVEPVRLAVVIESDPAALLEQVKQMGLEGVVAKRAESRYESGQRSGAWAKYRTSARAEFVIGGYLPGRTGLDALLTGEFRAGKLYFVKKLRNGFVPQTRAEVLESLQPLRTARCPFVNLPEPGDRRGALDAEQMKHCVWVEPKRKCEIDFAERTAGGRLRHAAFRQLV